MERAEKKIDEICDYMKQLSAVASRYTASLTDVNNIYQAHLTRLKGIVNTSTNWEYFTEEERTVTENTVLLVGLLYEMCKVKLVLKASNDDEVNVVNRAAIDRSIMNAREFLTENVVDPTAALGQISFNKASASHSPAFTVIKASCNEAGHVLAAIQVTKGTIRPGDRCSLKDSNRSASILKIKQGYMALFEISAGNKVEIILESAFSPAEILGKTLITL